jgi:hypothetical protein
MSRHLSSGLGYTFRTLFIILLTLLSGVILAVSPISAQTGGGICETIARANIEEHANHSTYDMLHTIYHYAHSEASKDRGISLEFENWVDTLASSAGIGGSGGAWDKMKSMTEDQFSETFHTATVNTGFEKGPNVPIAMKLLDACIQQPGVHLTVDTTNQVGNSSERQIYVTARYEFRDGMKNLARLSLKVDGKPCQPSPLLVRPNSSKPAICTANASSKKPVLNVNGDVYLANQKNNIDIELFEEKTTALPDLLHVVVQTGKDSTCPPSPLDGVVLNPSVVITADDGAHSVTGSARRGYCGDSETELTLHAGALTDLQAITIQVDEENWKPLSTTITGVKVFAGTSAWTCNPPHDKVWLKVSGGGAGRNTVRCTKDSN